MAINYEEEFRKHWRWNSLTGRKDKYSYFYENNITAPEGGCFACQYASDVIDPDHKVSCEKACPITWPGGSCNMPESPYTKWHEAKDISERKEWAKIISELPWVEK